MKKTSLLLLVLVLIFTALTGCTATKTPEVENPSEAATAQPIENSLRIISTVPSVTEILFALDCGGNIVGVDVASNYPEAATAIEKVGDYSGFDIEKVISLEPDIVFAGNKLQTEEISTLKDLGINVIETEPTGFSDIISSITDIGAVLGKESEAKGLTDGINSVIETIKSNPNIPENKPTIYYVMGIGEYGNWTSGEGSFINKAMEIAGAVCVTAGSPVPWMDYPLEDLIIADPDILLSSKHVTESDLLADPTYMQLTAIQSGNYFFINADSIERPGPRITAALEFIQSCILGE